jgi:phage terminase large subunit-like protein
MISYEKFLQYSADPAAFRADLWVEVDGVPRRFGEVQDPWQAEDFAACDPGWQRCIGRPIEGAKLRAYLERPRGHSKTTDIAVMVTWALSFAPKIVSGYAAAADKDQARLLRDAILKLLRLNPWLAELLEVQQYIVRNVAAGHPGNGSQLEILSSDSGSSYGILPSFVITDELTNWQGDGDLWHSLVSSAAKVSTCMLVAISNAGRNAGDCWQWNAREHARTSPVWHFRTLDGPKASWLSEATLEEQRMILPGAVYKRLWLNQWVQGGDALDGADITACITQAGPMHGVERGYQFVGGLDLSTKRDRSALVVLGAHHETQRVRLASVQSWAPDASGQINLPDVQKALIEANERYRFRRVYFDPFQAALMAQQVERLGVKIEEYPFSGGNCNRMASCILETFRSRRIDLYNDPGLVKDLSKLNIVEKSFGFKLEAARDASGHADRAIALAIALPAAMELAGKRRVRLAVGI